MIESISSKNINYDCNIDFNECHDGRLEKNLNKHFDTINEHVIMNIKLLKLIGEGGFSKVN
jgi:hypothetical protein